MHVLADACQLDQLQRDSYYVPVVCLPDIELGERPLLSSVELKEATLFMIIHEKSET